MSPLGEITNCSDTILSSSNKVEENNVDDVDDGDGDDDEIEGYSTVICNEVLTNNTIELPFLSPSRIQILSGDELYENWLTFHNSQQQQQNHNHNHDQPSSSKQTTQKPNTVEYVEEIN